MSVGEWAEIGTAVGTLVLAGATFWMAAATKAMAQASKSAVMLEAEPQLAMRELEYRFSDARADAAGLFVTTGVNAQIGVVLANPGRVRIQFAVVDAATYVNGEEREVGPFLNRGGVVHPGEKSTFYFPPTFVSRDGRSEVRLRYRIRYWAVAEEPREMRATVQLEVWMFPVQTGPWLFVEGPIFDVPV